MIELAGGSYVFEGQDDGNRSSTMTIQMEEFYAWAKEADYLIYNSTVDGELQGMGDLLLEGREENLTYFYRLKSFGKQAEDYGK